MTDPARHESHGRARRSCVPRRRTGTFACGTRVAKGSTMKRALGLLGLVVLLASSNASAEERSDDGPEPERSWYGYQTLAADGLAITMTGLGVQSAIHESTRSGRSSSHTTSQMLLVGGSLTYLFAAPTVHALHGHWGKAGGSFGL